jgi:hypothetical protein
MHLLKFLFTLLMLSSFSAKDEPILIVAKKGDIGEVDSLRAH